MATVNWLVNSFKEMLQVVQPLLVAHLQGYFDNKIDFQEALITGSVISFIVTLIWFVHHPYSQNIARYGMRVRIACCGLVYRKVRQFEFKVLQQHQPGSSANILVSGSPDDNKHTRFQDIWPHAQSSVQWRHANWQRPSILAILCDCSHSACLYRLLAGQEGGHHLPSWPPCLCALYAHSSIHCQDFQLFQVSSITVLLSFSSRFLSLKSKIQN